MTLDDDLIFCILLYEPESPQRLLVGQSPGLNEKIYVKHLAHNNGSNALAVFEYYLLHKRNTCWKTETDKENKNHREAIVVDILIDVHILSHIPNFGALLFRQFLAPAFLNLLKNINYSTGTRLPELVNKNPGCSVKFEFWPPIAWDILTLSISLGRRV